MTHYFCPTCGGVDDTLHPCETPGCERKSQDLLECDCDNSKSHKVEGEVLPEPTPDKAEDQ